MAPEKRRSYTAPFTVTETFYWAARCCLTTFGAVYLQKIGFSPAVSGAVLAAGTALPAFLLPSLAGAADRSKRVGIRAYLAVFCAAMLLGLLPLAFGVVGGGALLAVFFLLLVVFQFPDPFLASAGDYCLRRGIRLDIGISRSGGSLGFALMSYVLGALILRYGPVSIPRAALCCTVICAAALFFLPAMQPVGGSAQSGSEGGLSVAGFLRRYPRYTILVAGFFLIGVYHMMEEAFLINMMERIGGDSGSAGTALLIANVAEFVIIFFYTRIRKRFAPSSCLLFSAAMYVIRAFLYHIAPNVGIMYAAHALMSVTYGLYAMAMIYYVEESVSARDAVKGQSIHTALFSLGCGAGELLGGVLIQYAGVRVMTFTGFCFTAAGAVLVFYALRGRLPKEKEI